MNHNNGYTNGQEITRIQKSVALHANRLLQQKYSPNLSTALFSQTAEPKGNRPKKQKQSREGEDDANNQDNAGIAIFAQQLLFQTKMVLTGSDKERLFLNFEAPEGLLAGRKAAKKLTKNNAVSTLNPTTTTNFKTDRFVEAATMKQTKATTVNLAAVPPPASLSKDVDTKPKANAIVPTIARKVPVKSAIVSVTNGSKSALPKPMCPAPNCGRLVNTSSSSSAYCKEHFKLEPNLEKDKFVLDEEPTSSVSSPRASSEAITSVPSFATSTTVPTTKPQVETDERVLVPMLSSMSEPLSASPFPQHRIIMSSVLGNTRVQKPTDALETDIKVVVPPVKPIGSKACNFDGCDKSARGASWFCIQHGGGKRCQFKNCSRSARGSTSFCVTHGGGKRCSVDLCPKSAVGATNFCIAHGGGKRCKFRGCEHSAEGSTLFCIRHGGGKRCKTPDCNKSAVGTTDYCVACGGGRRCKEPTCNKSAVGATVFCKAHGGGRRCTHPDGCDKSAQGATFLCIFHGGGRRCSVDGCSKPIHGIGSLCKKHST